MSNNYTRWYREGTVNVTKNSVNVVGVDTLWSSTGLKPGDMFSVDNMTEYEIDIVNDNTHLTLKTAYTGDTAAGVKYRIIRNFTASSNADVAGMAAELMTDFAEYIDSDMKTLTGKSAYKEACDNGFVGTQQEWLESLDAYGVAVKNGYTGTRAEWLESLKAAGEWTNAKTRLTSLESRANQLEGWRKNWFAHNFMYRSANLGATLTDARAKAIDEVDYSDFYVGDYWNIPTGDGAFPILNEDDAANGDTYHDDEPLPFKTGPAYIVKLSTSNTQHARITLAMWLWNVGDKHWPYNYKNSNECGYFYSLINQKLLPEVQKAVENFFGESRVKTTFMTLSAGYDTAVNKSVKLYLPSVNELIGDSSKSKAIAKSGSYLDGQYVCKGLNMGHYLPFFDYWRRQLAAGLNEAYVPTRDMPKEDFTNYNQRFMSVQWIHDGVNAGPQPATGAKIYGWKQMWILFNIGAAA